MDDSQRFPRFTRYLRGFTDLETLTKNETSMNTFQPPPCHSLGWLKLVEIVEKRNLLNDTVSTVLQNFQRTYRSLEVSEEMEDPELYLIYMITNNEHSMKKLQATLKPFFPNISQKQIKELNKSVQEFMNLINSKCRRDVKKLLNFDKAVTPVVQSPINVPKKLVSWNQPDLSFLTELNQESYVDTFSMIPQERQSKSTCESAKQTQKEIKWLVYTLKSKCSSLFSSPDFTLADCICYIIGTLNSYRTSNDVSRLRQSLLDLLGNYEYLAEEIIMKRHLLLSKEIVAAVQTYISERRVSDAKYHYKNAPISQPVEEKNDIDFHVIPNKDAKYVKIKQNGDPQFEYLSEPEYNKKPAKVPEKPADDYVILTNSRLRPLQVQNKFELLTLNDMKEENEVFEDIKEETEVKIEKVQVKPKKKELKQVPKNTPQNKKPSQVNGVQVKKENTEKIKDEFTTYGESIAAFMRSKCTTRQQIDYFKARVGEIIMESFS